MSLEGKVAIITGGSKGIGKATAVLFANEGAKVIITGRNEEDLKDTVSQSNGEIEYLINDVSNEDDCKACVEHTVNKYGRVDILFNNAGIAAMSPTHETSVEDWDRIFNINVRGSFMMAKEVIPQMIKNGGGAIVNNASILGLKAIPGTAAYNSSKGAIVQFTRSLALEYGPQGIRVNCICPGAIDTPMLDGFLDAGPEIKEFLTQTQPLSQNLNRFGKPEEIAQSIKFLSDIDNVGFMSGAMLSVDGGWIAN